MYRAKVEAVDGLKVRAGGKWLTCIGNRVVRAGDMVWTDGRCVYGHNREPQTPIVIVTQKEKSFLPLFVYHDTPYAYWRQLSSKSTYYNLYPNNKLKNLDNQELEENLFFINDSKGRAYTALKESDSLKLIALNINNTGDLYTIYANARQITTKANDGYVQRDKVSDEVGIFKNYQLVSKISLKDLLRQSMSNVRTRSKRGLRGDSITNNAPEFDSLVEWGVIEDENHWAFTALVQSYTEDSGVVNSHDVLQNRIRYQGHAAKQAAYLCTPAGLNCFFDRESGSADYTAYGEVGNIYSEDNSNINLPTEHIPIQDGYYFTVNELKIGNHSYGFYRRVPSFANVSIYTPEGKLLLSDEFIIGTRFGICKARQGFFLEINDMQGVGLYGSKLFYPFDRFEVKAEQEKIRSGVYILEDGELEQIVDGYTANQKLRLASRRRTSWYKDLARLDDSMVRKTLSTDNETWNL